MGNLVDMSGWHTAAAITYADVNKAIAAGSSRPAGFTFTASDNSASAGGTFGAWQLRLGGSGPDINMELFLTGGTVSIGTTPYAVSTCAFPLLVRAAYIPHTSNPNLLNLSLDGTAPVEVGSFDPTHGDPTGNVVANAVLQTLLQQWLTANLGSFNAVFASVDLDAEYLNEAVNWLTPSYKGYAVVEPAGGATLDNSIFGVLCLIDNTQPSTDLAFAISPYAIPSGANAAFNIASDRFLQHMMLVAVPWMFKGITNDDPNQHFVIDNDGLRIRNKGSLTLTDTKLDNGHVVNPTIDDGNFSVAVDGTELVINITAMGFTYSPGIDVTLTYEGRSTLSLDTTNMILQLTTTTQTGGGQVNVSKGLEITEITLSVVAIVMGVVAAGGGFVAKAATSAVQSATTAAITTAESVGESATASAQATVSALRGLIVGTATDINLLASGLTAVARVAAIGGFAVGLVPAVAGIMTAVADGDYQSMPKITDLTSSAVGRSILWPQAVGSFDLASAQLNGALQFGLARA